MECKKRKYLYTSLCLLAAFCLWTAGVIWVDVRPIGPQGSSVGLATINRLVHELTGVHMELYILSDWLSLIPLGLVAGFALQGALQWCKRKRFRAVDASLLLLGGFYAVLAGVYALFELWPVNYRPLLIEGVLEASYPSSTTVLVMCVMPSAALQLCRGIKRAMLRHCLVWSTGLFIVLMVLLRLLSGVHWFSDIAGGILLSAGLVSAYASLSLQVPLKTENTSRSL